MKYLSHTLVLIACMLSVNSSEASSIIKTLCIESEGTNVDVSVDSSQVVNKQKIVKKAPVTDNIIEAINATRGSQVVEEHGAVDLGLSVLWATCHVDADTPDDYGGYYAWGEIEQNYEYSWNTYESLHDECEECNELEPDADVAYVKWGGNWRMPTVEEMQELIDNCSWEWVTVNGVKGYKICAENGNSIFLPVAGCRIDEGELSDGYYWTSTDRGLFLSFGSRDIHIDETRDRFNLNVTSGLTVRPVNGPRKVKYNVDYRGAEGNIDRYRLIIEEWRNTQSDETPLPMKTCELCGGTGRIAIRGGGLILGGQTCTGCFGRGYVSVPFGMFY